jgi:hypothetical protein
MTWTKLSDDWCDRPAMLQLSYEARWLALEALVWCNRHGQDGHVSRAALRRITDVPDPEACATELVAAGLWTATGDGWDMDWSDQPTAVEVDRQQQLKRERQQRWLDSRRDASRDASKDGAPPRPAPPRKGGEGGAADDDSPDGSSSAVPLGPQPRPTYKRGPR